MVGTQQVLITVIIHVVDHKIKIKKNFVFFLLLIFKIYLLLNQ